MRIKFLIFLLACIASCFTATACLCSFSIGYEEADKVVVGKVVKIERTSFFQRFPDEDSTHNYLLPMEKATISVVETFKGKKTEKSIFVYSIPWSFSDCGYEFQQGKTYQIYAQTKLEGFHPNLPSGPSVYFVMECTETKLFDKAENESLKKMK